VARPTRMFFDAAALLHNLEQVKHSAPEKKIMAMVKANAYGCGIENVIPILDGHVDSFGVACLEEAMAIRRLGCRTDCVLLEGVFESDELPVVANAGFQCVIHCREQLEILLAAKLATKIKIWLKIDTGMHRLGFMVQDAATVVEALASCPWVLPEIGLMTHFASADVVGHTSSLGQLELFNTLHFPDLRLIRSLSNSAAILSMPEAHADVVRPGIMLYGVSPFPNKTGAELGLIPVMRLLSVVSVIHHYPPHSPIGYGGTWSSDKASVIGLVPIGYGDGYPRNIQAQTAVWIDGITVPIVGRISMDMLTVDLTANPGIHVGSPVELWGRHIPVERVAQSAGTIGYELLTKITARVRSA
jgi:alanine racemase